MVSLWRQSRWLFAAVSHISQNQCSSSAIFRGPQAPFHAHLGTQGRSRHFSVVVTPPSPLISLKAIEAEETDQQLDDDDDDEDQALMTYRLKVVTGSVRGAGTHTPCKIQLFGTLRESPQYMMGEETIDEHGVGFARDSIKNYAIVCRKLGSLRRIHLSQCEHSLTELGSGWFLEKINVTMPDDSKVTFPCHAWLGLADDDSTVGEYERNLIPWIQPPTAPLQMQMPIPLHSVAAGLSIPHPEKLKMGMKGVNHKGSGVAGEDAYFYTGTGNSSGVVGMGVADGVYSWREQGIDSGVFARTLMETAQHMLEAGYSDVLKMMQIAARKVESEGIYGSSTMCLVSVDLRWSRIHCACLGDSGFIVIGSTPEEPKPHVKFRTSPQEHEFGHPYQLGHFEKADRPEDAVLSTLRAMPGDILILGSDGLFDNIFDRDICAIALKHQGLSKSPAAMVRELVQVAYHKSMDKQAFTPYSFGATEWFDMVYNGGKPDDITVVAIFLR